MLTRMDGSLLKRWYYIVGVNMPLQQVIWVAEQEVKAYRWLNKRAPHGKVSDMPKSHQLFLYSVGALNAGALGAGVALPYAGLARASGKAAAFTAEFEAGGYSGYTLARGRVTTSAVGRKYAMRYIGAKVGARFLGPIGVALLMYDAWHLGKFIGKHTNPFDS